MKGTFLLALMVSLQRSLGGSRQQHLPLLTADGWGFTGFYRLNFPSNPLHRAPSGCEFLHHGGIA